MAVSFFTILECGVRNRMGKSCDTSDMLIAMVVICSYRLTLNGKEISRIKRALEALIH